MSVKIGVILGSTRTKSLGEKLFKYLQQAMPTAGVDFAWIDLKDYPLPFYDHAETPLSETIQGLTPVESQWLEVLKQQDGYVILSPEYDHAITGSLKNALDFVGPETDHKPVQVVTYSKYSDGGMLAAASIVGILQMLKMMVLPSPVLLWDAEANFTAEGQLVTAAPNSAHFADRLTAAFAELIHYATIMKDHPYQP
ncbi:NADPH-dependent FMN reductase [Levilactobacillus tujiorum]|uniref:NAD(P)H-dependent oxidoreductase n=1 Tax=Levilactobacillus tujiorum TaxID=2912243 RepID=A0ABX1L6L0_9LACO|nr:NAD(P)H-dependent oxidoreductase [Levilactobacillus tujiorum]MCH5464853.1 NAD(P)H-dependent oxidoreductase [Levilactobacillus tujiorum]NLR11914.1 NAD(P)H-dependent oxidoreductase [Lactobacillus sp. HBUAS51387]NLR29888.1 NAD(P)H-dependent oxidoreductase [Levilactobacillus tujiorum]